MAHRPPDTLLRARSRFSQPLVLLDKPKPQPWLSPSRSPTGVVVPPNQLGIQVLRGRALPGAGASAQQRETQAEKGPQHQGSEYHGARQAEAGASRAWGASAYLGRKHAFGARAPLEGPVRLQWSRPRPSALGARRPAVLACAPPRRSTPGTWGMRADREAALSGPTRGNQGPARGRCELRKPLGPAGQSAAGPGDRCGPGGQARFPGRASPWNPSFLTPAWGALGAAALL